MTFKYTDLPFNPEGDENGDMIKTYVDERKAINTIDDLKKFVVRWRAVWGLKSKPEKITSEEEQSLVDGTFDAEQTLTCLKAISETTDCPHGMGPKSCAAMHIVLPWFFAIVVIASNHYGVPANVAIIQLAGGYGTVHA